MTIKNQILALQFAHTVLDSLVVSVIEARIIWEEGTSLEKMPPLDWPVGNFLD